METIILKVEGMACEKCSARIKSSLQNIEGVEEIVANVAEKTVTINATGLTKEFLSEEIEDLGFDVIG